VNNQQLVVHLNHIYYMDMDLTTQPMLSIGFKKGII